MKRIFYITVSLLLSLILATAVFAAPSVVEGDENGVSDLYAVLMSDNTLGAAPDENVSVNEAMAVAVRLHSVLYGKSIASEFDADTYYDYAVNNGIFASSDYTDGNDDATKKQVVSWLYNAAYGKVDFSEISPLVNDYIPDLAANDKCYAAVLSFTEAGIIEGYDEYGSFRPASKIMKYKLAEMIDKLLNPDQRVAAKYIKYAGDAPFYLIDDFIMQVPVVNVSNIASGWKYDYTGSVEKGLSGEYTNNITDLSTEDNITISRSIEPQSDGILQLEANFNIVYGFSGLTFQFVDSDGNVVYEMGTAENDYFYSGELSNSRQLKKGGREISLETSDPDYWNLNGRIPVMAILDLDEGTGEFYVAGRKIGNTHTIGEIKDVAQLRITSGIEERLEVVINQVHLFKNWHVNDLMRTTMPGKKPYGYKASNNVKVEKIRTQADNQGDQWSAKITATANKNSYAGKEFKAISGLAVMETYMLLPTGDDGAYFAITSGGTPVIKVETADNKFKSAGKDLISFSDNIWQLIRIEADTYNQTYSVRIRGKLVAENLPFLAKAKYFDGFEIGITPSEDCIMWFDDVEVYETFEYDDYCPEPVVVENDYLVGMSICNLWRNGSHYGWSYIQPHHEPITGYYDEGIPEAMDWEIKMLAEHGFDFYNFCWYSPQGKPTDPIKKSRMNDAIHDGYFNAKYSDKLKISLMFENASMRTAGTWTEFENNVWNYWKEWYFSDPRYFTIEEDGKTYTFLTIYQYQYFLQMCNDTQILNSNGGLDLKSGSDKLEAAIAVASQKLKWMSDDLVASGISDGLIVGFNNNIQSIDDAKNIAGICKDLGLDYAGVFPYSWGTTAYDLATQKAYIERGYENSVQSGIDLLALPCIGFNRIGWYAEEKFPLIANEDLKSLLEYFTGDYMKRFASDGGSWKQKYIQFATWNEFGEGHYFYPCDDNGGYAYLNTMAEVLSGVESSLENDTMPTQAQKDRIGHLFVGDTMYLRRNFDVVETMPETTEDVPGMVWKYNPGTAHSKTQSMYSGWDLGNLTEEKVESGSCTAFLHSWLGHGDKSNCNNMYYNGVLTTTTRDSQIYRNLSTPMPAEDADICYITLEVSEPYTPGEFFFVSDHPDLTDFATTSDGKRNYTQSYSYRFEISSTEKTTYAIDLKEHYGWKGNIEKIRFDTGSISGNKIKIYEIRFAKISDEALKTAITVDGVNYTPADYGEIRSNDRNEIYIAPAESGHLYRLLHIVYNWTAERDVLTLEMPDGKIVKFTVGSDVVSVDGENYKLDKKVELYDGVPVVPLMWLLKLGNYNYVYDFTKKALDVTVADKIVYHEIANFNAEGSDTGAFYTQNSNTSMSIVTDPYDSKNKVWQHNSSDPVNGAEQYNYVRTDFEFIPGTTYYIDFDARICPELSDGTTISEAQISFNARYADTALTSGIYDHNPSTARATLTPEWKHISFVYTAADTLDETSNFQQQISFYIPPYGTNKLGIDFQMDNLVVRTKPQAFKVINGNAEGSETGVWYSPNSVVSVKTESGGNKYWHVEYNGKNVSTWVYLRQHTTFEPGVTYYYSVDVRLGKDYEGNDATTKIDINPRYRDIVQENFTNVHDHNFNVTGSNDVKFTTSDNWTTCKGSFTVSMGYTPGGVDGGYDEITFFSSPVGSNSVGVSFDIDNFIVSTEFDDIYG